MDSLASFEPTSLTRSKSLKKSKLIETGRVEKGESSNQNFSNSYEDFKYNVAHQVTFKILPLSNKNKTTEDIRQYCTECGTKTKSNFKFCPSCGNKL
jgi:rRNA maturation endonuclease Nob1